jgi:polyphenol oxidase
VTNVRQNRPAPLGDAMSSDSLAQRIRAAGLDWIAPDWPAPPGVHAFVTTRNGGVSPETFLPAPPFRLTQVHGSDVVVTPGGSKSSRADAAVTFEPSVVLAVRVADCMPVLFADRAGSVIGIAHAGWRGMAAGVLENTIVAMSREPSQVFAWLGPAIGRAAFEVGADVRAAFVGADPGAQKCFADGRPGKWLADLEALARMRLARAGVNAIHGGGMCTASDPARFFSFRRDGTSGRMEAFLWREAPR